MAPVLVATRAPRVNHSVFCKERLFSPLKTDGEGLSATISTVLAHVGGSSIDPSDWERSRYRPTPTIIEAALALYAKHSVVEITHREAGAINLSKTSTVRGSIIEGSRRESKKSICFVTGVPGAGNTLVGLNMATTHIDDKDDLYSVFLSGNGPLVAVMREALARDRIRREREMGKRWQRINQPQRRHYQRNAYRVLLTRARQGMVLEVPAEVTGSSGFRVG